MTTIGHNYIFVLLTLSGCVPSNQIYLKCLNTFKKSGFGTEADEMYAPARYAPARYELNDLIFTGPAFVNIYAGFLLALRAAIEKDLRVLAEKNKTAGRLSTIKADVSEKNLTSTQ